MCALARAARRVISGPNHPIADEFAAAPWRDSDGPVLSPSREPAVVLSEYVWVGARAILLKGARIGSGAVIGAATVVDFEVPPGAIVAGNPARIVGTTDTVSRLW
jgi:acetyltransferase-like isoleucine patch superfamily enzyme